MNGRNILSFSLLLTGAIGTWYLAHTLTSDEVPVNKTQMVQNGFYLKSARIFGTAVNGQLLYEIEAEYAEQLRKGQIEFRNVEIKYTAETGVPWTMNADMALIGDDREVIELSGHVVAVSSEGFSGDVTEIRTSYLELEPELFRAQTDRRVQIRIGARSITATGMLAMLQTNQLQLKSNVSGKFVP
jgi:LPS export ABC transporter protein LptC